MQLQILEQQQGDQGGPDLDLQGVGAGAHEGSDAQVLLERLEEQFDLPALAVDGGDGGGSKAAMLLMAASILAARKLSGWNKRMVSRC